ncbi:hypothetical protein FKN01_03960 [Streptomyces sp. 130]|uniref:hypothetical protein n=1 Tax=Streptomyces sp. 130 TaxID=2591006 RepID=UPI00117F28E1|nr:hypothetical protein [Streptomyces sp. 130]TRV80916.1 hypothetical protein FKN01_03960 [Streptomyces sp. 130]
MCANDVRAAAVLAMPFLIRIAAGARHPYRADVLAEASAPAGAGHFGVASRDEPLLHRADTQDSNPYDGYGVEVTGYPAGWSITAARAAITADIPLLQPLLGDPDPSIRIHAAYTLATAQNLNPAVRSSFHARLAAEHHPIVRVPPCSWPPPKPPEPTPVPRPSDGCANTGAIGCRRPNSSWPPQSAGSASPTNPYLTTCAPSDDLSTYGRAHTMDALP